MRNNKATIGLPVFTVLFLSSVWFLSFVVWPGTGVSAAAAPNLSLSVPFTSQAPLAEWKDKRQQDACEEAAALMAWAWVKGENKFTKQEWRDKIIKLADWEKQKYGESRDVALADMVKWIFKDYFSYDKVTVKPVKSAADILRELEKGNIVLTPMNGQALKNPYFTPPGPERHMILVKGYDYKTRQFITNDPGTRRGENYRYSEKVLFGAIRSYQTGSHLPFGKLKKEMIVVEK
jgi:hypothetical protein